MNATDDLDADILALIESLPPDALREFVDALPPDEAVAMLNYMGHAGVELPASPLEQAQQLVAGFAERPHLAYLSERIAQAVADVEAGKDRRLIVEMPPRSGKSLLATQIAPAWILSTHPSWPILLTSYSGTLATSWGRQIRRWIAEGRIGAHLQIADDAGAAADWETTEGGAIRSRSIREPLTGFGAKVLIVDDPVKDHVAAHSEGNREEVWNWFQSVAVTRLHPPSLVIIVMTRWHEDDLVGRLLDAGQDGGDPEEWEVIRFPAIADHRPDKGEHDALGRKPGQPLYSPLIEETEEQTLERWEKVKRTVGTYTWSALYQQHPSPAKGAIFSTNWWHYWTTDPEAADGETIHLISPEVYERGRWVDSWDFTFDKTKGSDYVVGQRWVKYGANRYLIAQQRARMNFTEALAAMQTWAGRDPIESPHGERVHRRVVEKKANGAAIITTLRNKIAGIVAVSPTESKEARARAITPEIESHNVLLPHPGMPGYEWVRDLISEAREFPNGAHDDQVDALTQALMDLRDEGGGRITVPGIGAQTQRLDTSRVSAMQTIRR